jgi:circadian clock protein KaiC
LSLSGDGMSESDRSVSSLMDTWLSLSDVEANGERNRVLYLLKSRGMDHSKQLREYRLSERGVSLIDAYVGPEGVLTGTARLVQETRERRAALERQQATERRRRELLRKRAAVEREIEEKRGAHDVEEEELRRLIAQEEEREAGIGSERSELASIRGARL